MKLEKMSLEELKKLRKDVEKAIETFEARQLAEAREKLEVGLFARGDLVGRRKRAMPNACRSIVIRKIRP
ncbi:MAG: hypothetical protein U5K36_04905 [Roseovarius sp.]|nr:hypothetical protein [Roseovarius sp.]